MAKHTDLVIGVDFDGTCTTHDFPRIGEDIGAVPVLRDLIDQGHKLVLFTMRSDREHLDGDPHAGIHLVPGPYLSHAIAWFYRHGLKLYGVQVNPTQHEWTSSPKAYCNLYIDDAALGCPLKTDKSLSPKPFVDWASVRNMLIEQGILSN